MTAEKTGTKIDVKLELDRNEFPGPFNYPSFEHSIRALVQNSDRGAQGPN